MHNFNHILATLKKIGDKSTCLFGFSVLFFIKKVPTNECYIMVKDLKKVEKYLKNKHFNPDCSKSNKIKYMHDFMTVHIYCEDNEELIEKVFISSANFKYNIFNGKVSLLYESQDFHNFDNDETLYLQCMSDLTSNTPKLLMSDTLKERLDFNFRNRDILYQRLDYILYRFKSFISPSIIESIKNNLPHNNCYCDIDSDDNCSICLEKLCSEKCIKLSCNHHIHVKCAIEWETSKYSRTIEQCPLCRKKIDKNIF